MQIDVKINQPVKSPPVAVLLVAVAGHLLHDLAVDLVPQHLKLGGWLEDLVGEVQRALLLLGGVVAHVLEDGCHSVKDNRLRRREATRTLNQCGFSSE